MADKKESNKIDLIEIPEIKREVFKLTIIGDTPLLCNRFSDRQKEKILNKQTKKADTPKEAKNPVADFIESLYWISEKPKVIYGEPPKKAEEAFVDAIKKGARFGFPSNGIKKAAAAAGFRAGLTKDMVTALGFFHIKERTIEITGDIPEMDESNVRIPSSGAADIRFRGRFDNWKMTFEVICSKNVFPKEKVINLINYAGFSVGIGDWRPEKKGSMGTFHVAGNDEL